MGGDGTATRDVDGDAQDGLGVPGGHDVGGDGGRGRVVLVHAEAGAGHDVGGGVGIGLCVRLWCGMKWPFRAEAAFGVLVVV